MTMTSDAKSLLSSTIRSLRATLVGDPLKPSDFGALHSALVTEYRWSVRILDAGLGEAARVHRERLELWIEEQLRAQTASSGKRSGVSARTSADFLRDAEKQAAYTWVHRIVLLRILEARGLFAVPVVTGGWQSPAYRDFRALASGLSRGDETEGFLFLLHLVFEDLATELPGLYGPAGVADLIPIPTAVLRDLIDAVNDPRLDTCWTDDLALGWIYQYWNDPEREMLDAKLDDRGKLAPHEIASKTQLFTERYMVDWLLQNSLGSLWLAMCAKHGWSPDVKTSGTLDALENRRIDWRGKRELGSENGGVALTDLMPLFTDLERRWVYWVPQPLSDAAIKAAPDSIRDIQILDPAVGSGHFLVVVFGLLVALYHEEARHRNEVGSPLWTDRAIVERILDHNLYGIDLDPRAVQIAAAVLWLKAREVAQDARPQRLNLVASNLRLSGLPDNDPALVELRVEVEKETGIPGALTDTLIQALRGADHLGSLLKIDRAVDETLDRSESLLGQQVPHQPDLFRERTTEPQRKPMARDTARATLLGRLEEFLNHHTSGDDLGLRLRGEQLAAGVRFVRLMREGTYDLVVGNPPYQGTAKMAETKYIEKVYPLGKADLYAAFLLRGLELVRPGGTSALLTMRNWMFIKQYSELRKFLLGAYDLRALGDFDRGAFEEIAAGPGGVSVAVSVWHRTGVTTMSSVAIRPSVIGSVAHDLSEKQAATLCHVGRHTFDPATLQVVPEWPLVYWWDEDMLRLYQSAPLIGKVAPAKQGLATGNNARYLRTPYEVRHVLGSPVERCAQMWIPYIKGAAGYQWVEDLSDVLNWNMVGLEKRVASEIFGSKAGNGTPSFHHYFHRGVAFSMIGANFSARVHRYPSIFGNMGSSVFPNDLAGAVCAMNSSRARQILQSLNPGVHFEVGDVNRLPLFPIAGADRIFARIETAFTTHESHREPSVEFRNPGPSPWLYAQQWAQQAVDRPEGAPLPDYREELDPEPPSDHISFALGIALGRFDTNGAGILDPHTADLTQTLPHGMLFLDRTLNDSDLRDGLGHSATAPLHAAWAKYGPHVAAKTGLREWLATEFFGSVHKTTYDNRPIHWPLSSTKKTFVAWVNIHRFSESTLRVLLADCLMPTLTRLDGELNDLRAARDGADAKAVRDAEKQWDRAVKTKDELMAFIAVVEQCADRGAQPVDATCPPREQNARYNPDLDDGVMINAAALWPLLDPQWKDPKKWWKELATAKDKKDYDWAHLARRYWPRRVDKKCQQDPSLAVAHGCFWRYHPERAWAWELRLQDEIGPDFRIEETPYRVGEGDVADGGDRAHRQAWLRDHAPKAMAAIEKETLRRMGRGKKKRRVVSEMVLLESGLWTDHAADMLALEWRLSQLQGAECRIIAPDEVQARALAGPSYAPPEPAVQLLLAALRGLADEAADAEDADADQDADHEDGEEDET